MNAPRRALDATLCSLLTACGTLEDTTPSGDQEASATDICFEVCGDEWQPGLLSACEIIVEQCLSVTANTDEQCRGELRLSGLCERNGEWPDTDEPVEADRDADGVPASQDCDDSDSALGARSDDADCDGVTKDVDCDDTDPRLPTATDLDCDDVPVRKDCDDQDPDIGACPKGLEVIWATATISGGQATISCPSGKVVTGGGFESSQDKQFRGSIPSGDGRSWAVLFGGSGTVEMYAVCVNADAVDNYEVVARDDSATPNVSTHYNSLTCPNGKNALGFGVTQPDGTQAFRVVHTLDGSFVDGMEVTFRNFTSSPRGYQMRVVCADVDFRVVRPSGGARAANCFGPSPDAFGLSYVLSGGFDWKTNGAVTKTRPTNNGVGWEIRAVSNGGEVEQTWPTCWDFN